MHRMGACDRCSHYGTGTGTGARTGPGTRKRA